MKSDTKSYQRSLRAVAGRLADVARSLRSDGLAEQAQSIETTVADLDWQCEEFDRDAGLAVWSDRVVRR